MSKEPRNSDSLYESLIEKLYASINANDFSKSAEIFDRDILRIEPGGEHGSTTYRGLTAMLEHFVNARQTWADGACTPERVIIAGGTAVVMVHVRVRLKDKTDWIEGRIADGFRFVDGRISEMHTFLVRADALAWAGLDSNI